MDRSFYGRIPTAERDVPVCCPECGEELGFSDEVYTLELCGLVVGCSQCLHAHNAVEWAAEQREYRL